MGLMDWQRRAATGVNAALVVLFGLGALGLAVDLAESRSVAWDWSTDGGASLSSELRGAVERAGATGQTLEITAFSVQQRDAVAWMRDRMLRDVLLQLDDAGPAVRTRFVDFDRDRLTAEQLGVDQYGTVVVQQVDPPIASCSAVGEGPMGPRSASSARRPSCERSSRCWPAMAGGCTRWWATAGSGPTTAGSAGCARSRTRSSRWGCATAPSICSTAAEPLPRCQRMPRRC